MNQMQPIDGTYYCSLYFYVTTVIVLVVSVCGALLSEWERK